MTRFSSEVLSRQLVEEQRTAIAQQKTEIQNLAARLSKLETLVTPVP